MPLAQGELLPLPSSAPVREGLPSLPEGERLAVGAPEPLREPEPDRDSVARVEGLGAAEQEAACPKEPGPQHAQGAQEMGSRVPKGQ